MGDHPYDCRQAHGDDDSDYSPRAPVGNDPTDGSDDGTTVSVTKGTTIVVVLNSTYWTFPNPPNPAVVQQQGGGSHARTPGNLRTGWRLRYCVGDLDRGRDRQRRDQRLPHHMWRGHAVHR